MPNHYFPNSLNLKKAPFGVYILKAKGVAGGVDGARPGIDKTSLSPTSRETLSISIPGMGRSSPGLSVPRPTHFIPLLPEKSRGYSFGIVLPVSLRHPIFFTSAKILLTKKLLYVFR